MKSSPATTYCRKPTIGKAGDRSDINTLKESLSSIIQDDETKELRQRHNRVSSGAQKIMEKLASLRSEDVNYNETNMYNHHHKHRGRRRPKENYVKEVNKDYEQRRSNEDQGGLDTSSYSFASSCTTVDLDTSYASSLDDSIRSLNIRAFNNSYNNSDLMNSSRWDDNNDDNDDQLQELPPKRQTVTRRKSIPRHRNTELNSNISSCLRPTKYTTNNNSSNNNNSDNTLRTAQSFNSSMEDFNNSLDSNGWVASGVVIKESLEIIHMK